MMGGRRIAAAAKVAGITPGAAAAGAGGRPCSVPGRLDFLLIEGLPRPPIQQPMGSNAVMAPQMQMLSPHLQASLGAGSTVFDLDLGPTQPPVEAAYPSLCSADRSFSDLESYRELRERAGTTTEDVLLQLCLPHTDVELAVAEHLRHVRGLPRAMQSDTEELAQDLLGTGLLVQVRQGKSRSDVGPRSGRDCLRSLRHTFMVCTGYQRSGEATLFNEPLVVEPRFKEQFVIAHPTPEYAQLLQVLPVSFVGTVDRLEAAVRLLADQVAMAFRQAGRSLPPWRTAEAMMSKWAPAQLTELARMMHTSSTGDEMVVAAQPLPLHQQQQPPAAPKQAAYVILQGTPVAGLQRLEQDAVVEVRPGWNGVQHKQQLSAVQLQLDFMPVQQQQPTTMPASRVGSGLQQQYAVALEVVKSMSRQMSSTGMCAHSVPETQAALMQADSLRRSLCGVRPDSLHATGHGSSTGGGSNGGGSSVWSPGTRGCRSAGCSNMPASNGGGSAEQGGANAGAGSHVNRRAGRLLPGMTSTAGLGTVAGATRARSMFLTAVKETCGAADNWPTAAVGPAGAYMESAGPASSTTGGDRSEPTSGPVSSTNAGPDAAGMAGTSPAALSRPPTPDIIAEDADAPAMAAAEAVVSQSDLLDVPSAILAPLTPPTLPPHITPLKIVRQSSSDLKQAVRQARAQTRSALAAALKAAASAPSSANQTNEASFLHLPHNPLLHNHQGDVVLLTNGGAGVTPGMRLGVRRGGEDVWPPRITTVKWGAQHR